MPKQQKSQEELIEKTLEIKRKFGETYILFAERFNPSIQAKLLQIKADYVYCYNTQYPTLASASLAYTHEGIINWLKIQFNNLNDFVGVREKMTTEQIIEVATLFCFDCYFLNIAETALFFLKFKTGQFGEFYGSVDPLKIMSAKNQFLNERIAAINRFEATQAQQEAEKKREEWSKKAITYQEYLSLKQNNQIEHGAS